MNKTKTQTRRIIETYITLVVLVTGIVLVFSGIAVSKINTDYMQTGIRAGKIVAERENMQISVTMHDGITLSSKPEYFETIDKVIRFLPPPINTTYIAIKELLTFNQNYK